MVVGFVVDDLRFLEIIFKCFSDMHAANINSGLMFSTKSTALLLLHVT